MKVRTVERYCVELGLKGRRKNGVSSAVRSVSKGSDSVGTRLASRLQLLSTDVQQILDVFW